MPRPLLTLPPALVPALEAAGFVGTWDWNVTSGRVVLDSGSAECIAGNAALAGQIITLDRALVHLHPADSGWVRRRIQDMGEAGGSISAEYRVLLPSGEVRWLLDQGRVSLQPDGTLQGYGMWIDITESRTSGAGARPDRPSQTLELAADHCLIARDAIHQGGSSALKLMVDILLLELGRELSGVARSSGGSLH